MVDIKGSPHGNINVGKASTGARGHQAVHAHQDKRELMERIRQLPLLQVDYDVRASAFLNTVRQRNEA